MGERYERNVTRRFSIVKRQGNNLIRVKKQNEVLIKEIVYKYGPISRSEIAEMLSLTPPTITTNVNTLIKQGYIYELSTERPDEKDPGASSAPLGRRPVKIDFVEDVCYVVGAELNKYQIAVCVMNLRGKIKAKRTYVPQFNDYQATLQDLAEQIECAIQEAGVDREKILGVGVGLTGFVDSKNGVLKKSGYRNWETDQKVAKLLQTKLDLPVTIENNARMRAIGEEMLGNSLYADTFAYYLISYGLACPMYIKNSVLTGETSGAGEIGHVVVDIHGPRCEVCGDYGCLEELASERAILKHAKERMRNGDATMLNELVKNPEDLTMKEILAAEECQDELACEIVEHAIQYLGVQLANIINFTSPPLVIIDGYIMKLKRNRRLILEETRRHLFGVDDQDIEFRFIDFDQYTGAKGAGAFAIKKYFIEQ